MPQYKLMYFNIRALAEPIRFLFHYGGIEFEDFHYTREEWWGELKPKAPFGQGPLLVRDVETLWQSVAIQRLLAEEIGIAGNDSIEKLKIDMIAETIWDVRCMLYRYYFDKSPNKAEIGEKVFNADLPFVLSRLDKVVAENGGHFFGGRITWPDLQYTSMYEYLCTLAEGRDIEEGCPNLKALREKVHAIPNIKAYVDKRPEEPKWTEWSFGK